MKQLSRDAFELSSGRRVSANRGFISIRKGEDGEYSVGEGYDGHIDIAGDAELYAEDPTAEYLKPWTVEERRELADFMIARWQEFKESTTPAPSQEK